MLSGLPGKINSQASQLFEILISTLSDQRVFFLIYSIEEVYVEWPPESNVKAVFCSGLYGFLCHDKHWLLTEGIGC